MGLMDLMMLVFFRGRERTEAEFRSLLHSAGFTMNRVIPAGAYFLIECMPGLDFLYTWLGWKLSLARFPLSADGLFSNSIRQNHTRLSRALFHLCAPASPASTSSSEADKHSNGPKALKSGRTVLPTASSYAPIASAASAALTDAATHVFGKRPSRQTPNGNSHPNT